VHIKYQHKEKRVENAMLHLDKAAEHATIIILPSLVGQF